MANDLSRTGEPHHRVVCWPDSALRSTLGDRCQFAVRIAQDHRCGRRSAGACPRGGSRAAPTFKDTEGNLGRRSDAHELDVGAMRKEWAVTDLRAELLPA